MAFCALKKVNSSMIQAIAYDRQNSELLVQFSGVDAKSGKPRPRKTYVYYGVPAYVYKELLATNRRPHGSVGKVFYSLVRQEACYEHELVHVSKAP